MAGSLDLQSILGWVQLTRAVNVIKDGVPNPFPPFLMSVRGEDKVIGNSVKFVRTYGTRKTARVIDYGGVARHRENQQIDEVDAKMIAFGEEKVFSPYLLQCLRNF